MPTNKKNLISLQKFEREFLYTYYDRLIEFNKEYNLSKSEIKKLKIEKAKAKEILDNFISFVDFVTS